MLRDIAVLVERQRNHWTLAVSMFQSLRFCGSFLPSTGDDDRRLAVDAPAKNVYVEMQGLNAENGVEVRVYLLDEEHDTALVKEELFLDSAFSLFLSLKKLSTVLIELKKR